MTIVSRKSNGRRFRQFIAVLVLFSFAWRIGGIEQESLWRDEVDAIFFALGDLDWLLTMLTEPGHNGPLYFFSLRVWLNLVGPTEFALRYLSLLFGILTIPLTWQVARRLLPLSNPELTTPVIAKIKENQANGGLLFITEPALLAATFLAVNPHQLWYSQEGKMYTATTFIALLVVWLFIKGINRPTYVRFWLGMACVVLIGIYTHLLLALLLPLLAVWFIIIIQNQKMRFMGILFVFLMIIGSFIYRGSWILQLTNNSDVFSGRPFYPFPLMVQETFRYLLNGVVVPAQRGFWLIPIIALAVGGLLYSSRIVRVSSRFSRQESQPMPLYGGTLMIGTWLVIPLLTIYVLSLFQPIFAPRYIIWIAPALMMEIALGVQILQPSRSQTRMWLATFVVLFVISHSLITAYHQKNLPLKFDLRQAVNYLTQHREPQELLIFQIPHLEYAYRYYSGLHEANPFEDSDVRLGWTASGLWTNNGLNDTEASQQVNQEMRVLTEGARDIWVMRSEVEMWDARDLMDEWFRQNGRILKVKNFYGVQVVHYQLDS